MSAPNGTRAYVWWAAVITIALYTAGYSSIGFALLFFGVLWRLVTRRLPLWYSTPLDLPLAAFGAVLVLSAVVSPYRGLSLGVTSMLFVSCVVYFGSFCWLLHNDAESRMTLLRIWALGAPPTALVGLITGVITNYRAWIPQGVGPNGLGTTLLLGSILAIGLALRAKDGERLAWLGCGSLSFVGLLATGSRTSLVGWIAAAVYLAWREFRTQPMRMAVVIITGLPVLAIAGALTPQLAMRVPNTAIDIAGNRLRIWPASLGMIKVHPLLGTGFGTFEKAYEQVKAPGTSSEPFAFDLALNIAAETGILGLLSALWIAAVGVREWFRQVHRAPPTADPMRPVVAALWIGLLVDQLADNTLFSISTSAGLWLLLALLVVPPGSIQLSRPTGQFGPQVARMVG